MEFDLFKDLTGKSWYDDSNVVVDEEFKITEFDYENYISKVLLDKERTQDPEFKRLIRMLNLFSNTKLEQLQEDKQNFRELMPLLRGLSRDEADALIHKLRNSGRRLGDYNDSILNEMINRNTEKKLAKISEEENFLAKNRYRLQKTKLDFADKKRMPIDESKLKDVLRNRPSFR